MRTTFTLDTDLLAELRRYAAAHGVSMSRAAQDLLRESLRRRGDRRPATPPPSLPIFDGKLREGVDLDDSSATLDLMDLRVLGVA